MALMKGSFSPPGLAFLVGLHVGIVTAGRAPRGDGEPQAMVWPALAATIDFGNNAIFRPEKVRNRFRPARPSATTTAHCHDALLSRAGRSGDDRQAARPGETVFSYDYDTLNRLITTIYPRTVAARSERRSARMIGHRIDLNLTRRFAWELLAPVIAGRHTSKKKLL
jgi:hypothetical protein